MQEARVDGIDDGIQYLQPVATERRLVGDHLQVGKLEHVVHGKRRAILRRAHVGEHEASILEGRIRTEPNPILQPRLRGLGLARCFEQRAIDVEVPPVIAAAYPLPLTGPVLQGGLTVGTAAVHEPDPAAPVPEQHQVLAEDAQREGQITDLGAHGNRMPEAPQVLAAGRARTDPGQLVVGLRRESHLVAAEARVSNVLREERGIDRSSRSAPRRYMSSGSIPGTSVRPARCFQSTGQAA